MRYLLGCIAFFITVEQCHCQSDVSEKIIKKLRTLRLDSLRPLIEQISNDELKKAFEIQSNLALDGMSDRQNLSVDHSAIAFDKAIISYTIGDLFDQPEQDSLAFKNYMQSYHFARESRNNLLINESLRKINEHLMKNSNRPLKVFEKYQGLYRKNANNPLDIFWSKYFESIFLFQKMEKEKHGFSENDFEDFFSLSKELPDNEYAMGRYFQLKGIIYSFFLVNMT